MSAVSIPRVGDRELLKLFIDETLKKYEELGLSEAATCTVSQGGFNFTVDIRGATNKKDILEDLRNDQLQSSSVTRLTIQDVNLSGCIVYFKRNSDVFIDEIGTIENGQRAITEQASTLFRHINRGLNKHASSVYAHQDENSLQIASAHHEVLTRLEGLSAELIEKQFKQSQDLERDKQQFLDDRGADFVKKVNDQDEAYSKKVNDLEEQHKKRSEELDDKQKKIDDADNTSTRRKTTTRTLEEAQEKARKFSFSSNVGRRTSSAFALGALLVFIGALTVYTASIELSTAQTTYTNYLNSLLIENTSGIDNGEKVAPAADAMTKQTIYFLYIRIVLGSALMISSIVYLIRWFNNWADRIAQQELDNQIFIRDLNRAQLAVEMSLEWNEKKDGEIPFRLLESLTEGLFKPKDAPNKELLHPAEQIAAALLKTADKVTLPLGRGTIETSGKKMDKAKPVNPVPDQSTG
ncbi:hypothetical protein LMH78_24120 [Vibrio lentus]|uniref:hypothetical protein n=1 Tax=Vibrio lentus TaxID=136468 RepID=UPI001E605974|nr:hypothetical protein [Vibrio lentus]MCC4858897.1 hypothetical protein [Vibrio lentus]